MLFLSSIEGEKRECERALALCFILGLKPSFLRAETLDESRLRTSSEDGTAWRRNAAGRPRQRHGQIERPIKKSEWGATLCSLFLNSLVRTFFFRSILVPFDVDDGASLD